MTDILIRDVPDELLATIDAKAKRLGLSRTAYLRRALERERLPTRVRSPSSASRGWRPTSTTLAG